ncbi:hypothetical protein DIPPA_35272 [Diplonema papillatum]|nr:hypothetical protein DIPPA_35272 [Diplonema papillatum]
MGCGASAEQAPAEGDPIVIFEGKPEAKKIVFDEEALEEFQEEFKKHEEMQARETTTQSLWREEETARAKKDRHQEEEEWKIFERQQEEDTRRLRAELQGTETQAVNILTLVSA